ncbi:hypothetical protein OG749_36380 [Streptomyces nojiriensis]|uniref:hypothetical protein n=1 Tax=Streptomyces nojiriensis TaxID=66374 RepID=UPI002E172FD8
MAITVGSVEVDVIPNTRGIYARLRAGLVPAATRAGDEAGEAAGRSFGPAMQRQLGAVGLSIGQQIGQQIANRITAQIRDSLSQGLQQGGPQARATAAREGQEVGGAFSRSLKARLEAAFRSLPRITVDADTSEADADLQALRVRMETLAGQRIGIDIDVAEARAEVRYLEAELRRLGAQHPNVQVRADTAAARAQLALVHAEIDAVDGKRARIDVDTSGALSAILHLTVAIGGLAVIPAVPILAAGIGAIGSAAVASAAGVGALAAVAAPAFIGIAGALQAQKAAQDASTAASQRGAQAGAQASSRALQAAGAQQSLAAAQRNAASQIASARDQVRQAARGVGDAERQLAEAQKNARQAQLDLVSARKEAAQQLEDLSSRYADAQLSVRESELSLAEAQQRRRDVEADPKSTLLDRQRATLAVDQATQRLKQQTVETKRLAEEQATANKTGVEGTQVVKQAQDRLAQSQQTVTDRTRGVADAQAAVVKAQENVAKVSAQAADSIASAQRQIASASASAAGGIDQAAIAQANYQAALEKLSPSARGTFDAFQSLRSAFKGWSESLQPAVMPLFTRALDGMRTSLPGLTPFVLAAAKAIGILQDKVSAGFKSPWWISFRDDLAKAVVPATVGLGTAIGNVFKTIAGVVDAFLPHMDSISERMREITGRWAEWATGLKGTDKFERFLSYSSTQAPILARTLGAIAGALFEVSRAASPLAGPVLTTLGAVFTVITSIATTLPWLIQLMYAAWVATKLWTLGLIIYNAVLNANPIVLIITAIVALVAAVIYAYKHWTWFREVVDAAWRGIQAGAAYVWSILQPILAGIWAGLQVVGAAALWFWENGIKPAFENIWLAARVLWAIVAVAVIAPLVIWFKILGRIAAWLWETFRPAFESIGAAAMWLWTNFLRPVFGWIAEKAVWLWQEKISPAWESLRHGTGVLGQYFRDFWNDYVKPVFNWIAEKAVWLYETQLRPAFDNIKTAIGYVKDAFSLARDGIKVVWDQLVEITRKPVQIIVDTVYNKGIRPVWNAVAKIVKLDELKEFKFAQGGVLPGYTPGRDPHTFYSPTGGVIHASGGEAFMRPEFTRAVGAGWIGRMNAAARSGGVGGVRREMAFKDGGILDKIVSGAKTVGGWIGDGVDVIANPSAAWEKATGFIREAIADISGNPWASAVAKLPIEMLGGLKKSLVESVSSLGSMFTGGGGGGGPVGGGVSRWTGVVQQALQMVGQPLDYTGITLRRMEQESGGNPNIVNTWDSNWIAGYPSVGLMQVIGPTFRAYAGAMKDIGPFLYGTSVNPLANVYASMRYALAQYGSLPRAYNRAGGYDSGGYLQPGLNLAYNGTGRPEPVFTTQQANALMRLSLAPGSSSLQPGDSLTLVVDGREFNAYVDTRADARVVGGMRQLAQTARPGRRG